MIMGDLINIDPEKNSGNCSSKSYLVGSMLITGDLTNLFGNDGKGEI